MAGAAFVLELGSGRSVSFCPTSYDEFCRIASLAELGSLADVELSSDQLSAITTAYHLEIGSEKAAVLRRWNKTDLLPYSVHTGRELELMRKGIKPLAAFSEFYPSDSNTIDIARSKFSREIESKQMVSREYISISHKGVPSDASVGVHHFIVALASEQWRLDAYIILRNTASQHGWNDALIRIEGDLLGYEAWQTDFFLQDRRSR